MKRHRLLIFFLIFMTALNLFAEGEKKSESVDFKITAYKRTPLITDPTDPGFNDGKAKNDKAATIKVFDSLSTRLGRNPQLSGSVSLDLVSMNSFMDEFFNKGIHVAMISVTAQTGYADHTDKACIKPKLYSVDGKYASHTTTVKIKATPMKVTAVTDKGKVSAALDNKAEFVSKDGNATFPVELFFKTSKLVANERSHRTIVKDKNSESWWGVASTKGIPAANDPVKDIPYREYELYSTYGTDTTGAATLELTFNNNTVRQEHDGKGWTWVDKSKKGKPLWYKADIQWTAENQLWIKGDRAAFDRLPAGEYQLVIRMEIVTTP